MHQGLCFGGAEASAGLHGFGRPQPRAEAGRRTCSAQSQQQQQASLLSLLRGVASSRQSTSHRRQPPSRRHGACTRAAASDSLDAQPDEAAEPSNEELLARLRAAGVEALAATTPDDALHPRNLSFAFLCWLSDREAEAAGADKVELGALAAAIIALREGLRPLAAADYAAMAEGLGIETGSAGELEALPRPPAGELTEDELAQIAQRRAALALSPAGSALAEQQVAQLEDGMAQARVRSALELLGRAPVPTGAAGEANINAAAATDRILDFLLEVAEAGERAALLPDAFTPPGPDAPVSEDEMQLSTRPLLLLNAIDARISMLQTAFDARLDLADAEAGEAAAAEYETSQRRLAELRDDVLRFCEF